MCEKVETVFIGWHGTHSFLFFPISEKVFVSFHFFFRISQIVFESHMPTGGGMEACGEAVVEDIPLPT